MLKSKIFRSFANLALMLLALMSIGGCDKTSLSSTPKNLPSFELTLLDGSKFNESQLKGNVAIINFWATTCSICVKEMPKMIQVFEDFKKQGFKFLAIAMSYDPPMYVVDFTQSRMLPFLVAMDSDAKVGKQFGGIEATPTTFLVNKDGEIIKKYVGEPNWDEMRSLIQASLNQR